MLPGLLLVCVSVCAAVVLELDDEEHSVFKAKLKALERKVFEERMEIISWRQRLHRLETQLVSVRREKRIGEQNTFVFMCKCVKRIKSSC